MPPSPKKKVTRKRAPRSNQGAAVPPATPHPPLLGPAGLIAYKDLVGAIGRGVLWPQQPVDPDANQEWSEYDDDYKDVQTTYLGQLDAVAEWHHLFRDDAIVQHIARIAQTPSAASFEHARFVIAASLRNTLADYTNPDTHRRRASCCNPTATADLVSALAALSRRIHTLRNPVAWSDADYDLEYNNSCNITTVRALATSLNCKPIIAVLRPVAPLEDSPRTQSFVESFVIPRCYDLLGVSPALGSDSGASSQHPRFQITDKFSTITDTTTEQRTVLTGLASCALEVLWRDAKGAENRKNSATLLPAISAVKEGRSEQELDHQGSLSQCFRHTDSNNRKEIYAFYKALVHHQGRPFCYWVDPQEVQVLDQATNDQP